MSKTLTFWEHVEEFRQTCLQILFLIALGFTISLIFYPYLFSFIESPLNESTPLKVSEEKVVRISNTGTAAVNYQLKNNEALINDDRRVIEIKGQDSVQIKRIYHENKPQLYLFSPVEGFSAMLMLCFSMGLVATSPIWLFIAARFFIPALKQQARRLAMPFLTLAVLFFFIGIAFAYFFTLPLASYYFSELNDTLGINLWSLKHYIHYSLTLLVSSGLAFELWIFLLFLVHLEYISFKTLIQKRRYAILVIFIISAIFTPPDVFSQLLLAIPLLLLYEGTVFYGRLVSRRKIIKIN